MPILFSNFEENKEKRLRVEGIFKEANVRNRKISGERELKFYESLSAILQKYFRNNLPRS